MTKYKCLAPEISNAKSLSSMQMIMQPYKGVNGNFLIQDANAFYEDTDVNFYAYDANAWDISFSHFQTKLFKVLNQHSW